ncbi:MAG: hypothetical protein U0401_12130 [Anaerolineae bacterium]
MPDIAPPGGGGDAVLAGGSYWLIPPPSTVALSAQTAALWADCQPTPGLFYAIFDEAAKTVTVWELNAQGEQTPSLYQVKMEELARMSLSHLR